MKEMTKTGLLAAGTAALLAVAALAYTLFPGTVKALPLDGSDLGEGALVAIVLWLALRKQKPMPPRVRLILGVAVGCGLLLGLAVFFIS